jgi:hypothetical protein
MSQYLTAYELGASSIGVHVLRSHSAGSQTVRGLFYRKALPNRQRGCR